MPTPSKITENFYNKLVKVMDFFSCLKKVWAQCPPVPLGLIDWAQNFSFNDEELKLKRTTKSAKILLPDMIVFNSSSISKNVS